MIKFIAGMIFIAPFIVHAKVWYDCNNEIGLNRHQAVLCKIKHPEARVIRYQTTEQTIGLVTYYRITHHGKRPSK